MRVLKKEFIYRTKSRNINKKHEHKSDVVFWNKGVVRYS